MSQIPDQYKQKSYYSEHKDVRHYLKDDLDESHVLKDPQTETRVMQIFDEDFSPALATHDELKQTPKTYIIIFEWDSFKDENLLYAQKLKQAGKFKYIYDKKNHKSNRFHTNKSFKRSRS